MITAAYLKKPYRIGGPRSQHRSTLTLDNAGGYSFAVQSGLLVVRHRDGVISIPLTDVSHLDGCPAAPPKEANGA